MATMLCRSIGMSDQQPRCLGDLAAQCQRNAIDGSRDMHAVHGPRSCLQLGRSAC
jgi:hypothetical protein